MSRSAGALLCSAKLRHRADQRICEVLAVQVRPHKVHQAKQDRWPYKTRLLALQSLGPGRSRETPVLVWD